MLNVSLSRSVVLSVATILAVASSSVAHAGGQGSAAATKASIQAMYNKLSVYTEKMDAKNLMSTFASITTPDFVYINKAGQRRDRDNMLQSLKSQFTSLKSVAKSTNKIIAMGKKGGNMLVTVKSVYDMKAVAGKAKKPLHVQGISQSIDTWVPSGKGWKLKKVLITLDVAKVNGKKMP